MSLLKQIQNFIILCTGLLLLAGCSKEASSITYMGHWNLIEIEYEDRASKQLEEGNAVVFEVDTVVEQIKGLGNRRYSYKAQGSTLTLDMGGVSVKWEIDSLEANAMDIATPIGTYKLVR